MAKYAKCVWTKYPGEYTVGRVYRVLKTAYASGDFDVIDDTGDRCWQEWQGDIWTGWEPVSYTHAAAEAHNANFPTKRMRDEDAAYKAEEPKAETVKIVHVKFGHNTGHRKSYAYYTDIADAQVGDTVVVDIPNAGLACVTVVDVEEAADTEEGVKWIVDKVDTTSHLRRLAAIEERKAILAKLEKLEKEQGEAARFAALAASNPEAAKLVEQLRAIK